MSTRSSTGSALFMRPYTNPFKMTQPSEMFGYKEAKVLREREARSSLLSMSLVQRTNLLQPKIPPCKSQQTTISRSTNHSSNVSTMSRREGKEARSQRITEFIQSKREVYMTQLLIDMKTQEINRLKKEESDNEKEFADDESEISKTGEKYKYLTTKIEEELGKARKAAELATLEHVTLQQKQKRQKLANDIMRSEISKNEETLEYYKTYQEFIDKFNDEHLMDSPDNLINEFTQIENENLFLIRECDYFQKAINGTKIPTENIIKEVNSSLAQLEEIVSKRDLTSQSKVTPKPEISEENTVAEIKRLAELIHKTFYNCFKIDSDIPPIAKLEKIENTMEDMYKALELVSPKFIAEKQAKFDKDRRELMRIEQQKEKERIQQEKKEQALERANKPIKRNTGRHLMERSLPLHYQKTNNEALLRQIAEQQAMEKFLFGPALE